MFLPPASGNVSASSNEYVSRGGMKLAAALHAFEIDATGLVCADFGSHVGGFVDCLLKRGAARVYAVDPGYGILDYRLRRDPRVVVCERTNAMRFASPEPCDLITIDAGWTVQRLILPAARRCLKPSGIVLTLIKPHYESPKEWLIDGVVAADRLSAVLEAVRADVCGLGWTIVAETDSPIEGHGGNREFMWRLAP
jgi:23S rRNA (cytidine1920-2'-O)/16S rRNA (cytidine1409-2'-O)-methyltransferase